MNITAALRRLLGRTAQPAPVEEPRPLVTYTNIEPTYASERERRFHTDNITR